MSEVFKAKVRKIGNARGVIIPKDILKKIRALEGDTIQLMIPITKTRRLKALRGIAGRYKTAKPFEREYEDRY
ncbi:MAG: AbrB family transcriptional regulator [Candidatus Hydrothermarchaeaceae archaeon]